MDLKSQDIFRVMNHKRQAALSGVGALCVVAAGFTLSSPTTSPRAGNPGAPLDDSASFVSVKCSGSDDTSSINAATAGGQSVRLIGACKVTDAISLSSGQCLYGDGDHKTAIRVGPNFSASAKGVITLSGFETLSPCVHDLDITFDQPSWSQATTVGNTAAGEATIRVAQGAIVSLDNYVTDATNSMTIPPLTQVTSVSGNLLKLSKNVMSPGLPDGHAITLIAARPNYLPLGSCTAGAGGTGCIYPPAIYAVGERTNRPRFWNLHIEGASFCVNTTGNVAPTMENIECGALNIGWQSDGAQDFSHVRGWHNWPFGFLIKNSTSPYLDGITVGWEIGRMDGLNATDISFFSAKFVITENSSRSASPSEYSNVMLDGNNSDLQIRGGASNQFVNIYKTGNSISPFCPISSTGGFTQFHGGMFVVARDAYTDEVCVAGGEVRIIGTAVIQFPPARYSIFSQTGGVMEIGGVFFKSLATLSKPLIIANGGSTIVRGNVALSATSGTAVRLYGNNVDSVVANNDFGHYDYSLSSPSSSGHAIPTVSNCGIQPRIDEYASAKSGVITVGRGTVNSCTVSFGKAYSAWNHCLVTSRTLSATGFKYTYDIRAITVTAPFLAKSQFDFACDGN